jgi:crotonobetaine/carnitine-CoA ligase
MGWSFTDSDREWSPASSGFVREDMEVKLLDEDDNEVAAGEPGEVCIRPRVPFILFDGYFDDPEATVVAFRNLWYHSGDLARFNERGELFFVDRKKDCIRYKGRNISSMEVEAVAAKHPAVREVAAIGVPAEELDTESQLMLCVVRHEGTELAPEELARFINDHAPYFMVPRYIAFVDELPHTPTGRVQKFKLREQRDLPAWDREAAGFVVRR